MFSLEREELSPEYVNSTDPYKCDPCFATKEELEAYLDSISHREVINSNNSESGPVIKRLCTCNECTELSYGHLDHLCNVP